MNRPKNQHFVPRFILRNFLCDKVKEQVAVFDKEKHRVFKTKIDNIMSETKFHDFTLPMGVEVSAEEVLTELEGLLLPVYREVVKNERLPLDPEKKRALALLVVFQMTRTRSERDLFTHMEDQIKGHMKNFGLTLDDIAGYAPMDDNNLTQMHIQHMENAIPEFAQILAQMDFLLLKAPSGQSFYLGDHPVVMHNHNEADKFWGNIYLTAKGIQIYMPLSSSLTLAIWAQDILAGINAKEAEYNNVMASAILSPNVMGNPQSAKAIKKQMEDLKAFKAPILSLLGHFQNGTPLNISQDNLTFQNTLQISSAKRFVVGDQLGFDLAKRFNQETARSSTRVAII